MTKTHIEPDESEENQKILKTPPTPNGTPPTGVEPPSLADSFLRENAPEPDELVMPPFPSAILISTAMRSPAPPGVLASGS